MSGKGAGKTPLLSACGLFCLLSDGEASPHVISMASSFEQARLTHDAAKDFIRANPAASRSFATPNNTPSSSEKNQASGR